MKTINISDGIHKEIKYISAMKNKKLREIVEEALLLYIKENEDADLTIIHQNGRITKEYYE